MYFEINVSKNGVHYLATAERYSEFLKKINNDAKKS